MADCKNCGTSLRLGAKLCIKCGTRVAVEDLVSRPAFIVEEAVKQSSILSDSKSVTSADVESIEQDAQEIKIVPALGEASVLEAESIKPKSYDLNEPVFTGEVETVITSRQDPAQFIQSPKTSEQSNSKNFLIGGVLALLIGLASFLIWQQRVSVGNAEMVAKQNQQQLNDKQRQLEDAEKKESEARRALALQVQTAEDAKRQAAIAKAYAADAESKAREATDAQTAASRSGSPSQSNQTQAIGTCKDFQSCFNNMLKLSMPLNEYELELTATKIASLNNYQRGDRKVARDLNQRGLKAFGAGDYMNAANLFKQAAEIDQGDVEIWANLGFAYIKNNQSELAGNVLGHALILNPRRTATWTSIAEFFSQSNNADGSTKSLLIGYRYSGNIVNTMKFYQDKADSDPNPVFKMAYQRAIDTIMNGNLGYRTP